MEELLDSLWFKIEILIRYLGSLLDFVFAPLDHLGPAVAISIIALIAVAVAKYFTGKFKTRRYKELEKQFFHWYNVRQEAKKCDDPEKAKLLAQNIDQAKLNRVYYDYFLEGFLNNILTMYLPILLLLAYVNEAYSPGNLMKRFGREYIFKVNTSNGQAIFVGTVFWFIVSVLLVYLAWYVLGKVLAKPPEKKEEYKGSGN